VDGEKGHALTLHLPAGFPQRTDNLSVLAKPLLFSAARMKFFLSVSGVERQFMG
jgi:hypothetical protein